MCSMLMPPVKVLVLLGLWARIFSMFFPRQLMREIGSTFLGMEVLVHLSFGIGTHLEIF